MYGGIPAMMPIFYLEAFEDAEPPEAEDDVREEDAACESEEAGVLPLSPPLASELPKETDGGSSGSSSRSGGTSGG